MILPQQHPWANLVQQFPTLPSTNTYAKQLAAQGAPEGTAVLADCQTAGRGRMGRSFHSPENQGIYLSLILRPHCAPRELLHLTCAVAVAACNAVEQVCGIRPGVKWINDLIYRDRKLAGILTELSLDPVSGLVDYAVVGIGINCNGTQEDFPPELQSIVCTLAQITGSPIDRDALINALLDRLFQMNNTLLSHRDTIMEQYRRDCSTVGADILVLREEERRDAKALSVENDGGLTVQYPDGTIETLHSGEVSVRKNSP